MAVVISSIIQGLFGVIVLVLGVRLNGKLKAVRRQVENGHDTNMREEGDQRHEENTTKLNNLLEIVKPMQDDVLRVRKSLARVWQRLDGHTDAIHELELTSPGSRFAPQTATPRHRKEPHHEQHPTIT